MTTNQGPLHVRDASVSADPLAAFDDKIEALKDKMHGIVTRARDEGDRALRSSEISEFDRYESQLSALEVNRDAMAATRAKEDAVAAREADHAARVQVHSRELGITGDVERSKSEYARQGGYYLPERGRSWFRDVCYARSGDFEAQQRLATDAAQTRALSTTTGGAGEFVPPLWLTDQFIALARAGRVSADVLHHEVLPSGTDSINIPKIATGTTVAQQTTQNSPVSQVDMTTTSVSAPVITLAGAQTVSAQLVDQSPINVDRMVIGDLAADYARALNVAVLTGTGAGGQLAGLASIATVVDYTSSTPTSMGVIEAVSQAIAQVSEGRFAEPTHILMRPTRWSSLCSALDNQNRPLVVPDATGVNTFGSVAGVRAQGFVGTLLGLPVYVDPSIPKNLGAATNQDEIFVLRADDSHLYESSIKVGAFEQTYAQNLSWLVRAYGYVALAHRHDQSVAVVSGTGMTPAVFGK